VMQQRMGTLMLQQHGVGAPCIRAGCAIYLWCQSACLPWMRVGNLAVSAA
jgi:hypothetical protein